MKHGFNTVTKCLFLLVFFSLASVAEAKITLTLDRSDIHEHETFHLRIQVEESNTLNAGANTDFIPDGITVRSRQEYNNSIIVNGQYNTKMGWDFELLAEKAGTYTIPALTIGNERSEPFTIRVLPEQDNLDNAENAKIKLRANISEQEVYVQQQLIFTVRIYRSVVARNQQITPIRVTNALVEQLGENQTFDVVKNGNNFRVIEQRYAIFPQQSGDMVIEPITYSATILEETANSRSPWQRSQLKPISLSTQKYTIKVKPKPQNAAEPWLPATKLELEAKWQPQNQTFTVGEPANLDFIIKGTGLLKTQLPTVSIPQQDGVTIYRDTPQYHQRFNRFGVNSYHFEKVAIIPSQAGDITIPEIKIPWWNVNTDQQEYAILPAQTIKVEPSSKQLQVNKTDTVIPKAQQEALNNNSIKTQTINTDISGDTTNYWKYISLSLVAIWLLTLLFWFKQKNNNSHQLKAKTNTKALGEDSINASLAKVQQVAKSNDAAKTAKLLSQWIKTSSLNKTLGINNLNQLSRYCRKTQQLELSKELDQLQSQLYSKTQDHTWQGQRLAKLLSGLKHAPTQHSENTLPDLYDKRD